MTEEVEDRSLEEPVDLEGNEDEFSKCGKSKIKYTRALLLEFTEVEVCRKLPRDFDLLIFRELDGASDGMIEQKKLSGNSSLYGTLPSTRRNLGFPGERWDNHLLMPIKESHSQGNCSSERSDVVCQQLPQESEYNAGVLGKKIQKNDLFQLRKSENPYRPPHCNKKVPQPLDTFSELGVESSGNSSFSAIESDQRDSADNITGNDKSGYGFPLAGADDSIKKSLGECEAFWRNNEGSEMIGANDKLEFGLIEDNHLTFDDFWAEILEILQLQQESELTPTPTHDDTPDSEVEICLPDEDSLILVDHSTIPDDVANSEAEISLPDEDSLISIYDMIAPYSSMPTLNRDLVEVDKVTSNMAVDIRKNSESINVTKGDDRSTTLSCKVQSFLDFSGLVTHGKLHSQLSHSQTSTDIFGPEKPSLCLGNDHMNFLAKFMTPYIIPYIPTLDCFTCSNFHHQSCLETTLTKTKTNSLVQYSLFQQPNICPEQQNHLLVDKSCPNPIKQVATPDLNEMQFLRLTSQRTTYQGFGKSNAGGFGDKEASGFWSAPH
ncbi:hypothetical protein Pfo_014758 [Paulownia fortunei]|nr:hypothetical protein Pfo_014758 [Paulownia fortunei]